MVASHRDGGDVSESSLSSEDELVENSNQRNPLQGAVYSALPEEVEVFGGLHMLLVCRILKTYASRKN